MLLNLVTRTQRNFRHVHFDQGNDTRTHTRDLGMLKNITASITFSRSKRYRRQQHISGEYFSERLETLRRAESQLISISNSSTISSARST